MKYFGYIN